VELGRKSNQLSIGAPSKMSFQNPMVVPNRYDPIGIAGLKPKKD